MKTMRRPTHTKEDNILVRLASTKEELLQSSDYKQDECHLKEID